MSDKEEEIIRNQEEISNAINKDNTNNSNSKDYDKKEKDSIIFKGEKYNKDNKDNKII